MATEEENLVSQPPLMVPAVGPDGSLSRAWSIWFRDLYKRVAYKGGNAIDDNTEAIKYIFTKPRDVDADTTASVFEFLSVTCSTVDITVILPDAKLTPGVSIWIHKADATAFKVRTSVGDIFFQGTTIHLISNGIDWIPS